MRIAWGEVWRYGVASGLSLLGLLATSETTWPTLPLPWSSLVHAAVVVAALVAMRWRRRHPLAVCTAVVLTSLGFPVVGVCASWAYLSLATHRGPRWTIPTGVLLFAANAVDMARRNAGVVEVDVDPAQHGWVGALVGLLGLAFVLLGVLLLAVVGSYIGARREARQATEERIAALERERELRADAARAEERVRLAREMHDVLAHKISLIAMHAGALAYRDDLGRDEIQAVAGTIQQGAQQALAELRTILGQLRQVADDGPTPPQPTLSSLDALLAEHREVGRRIEVHSDLEGQPGDSVGRHAYRIVQECLTNAARHSPGSRVRLSVTGSADTGLSLLAANPLSVAAEPSPGSGLGLIGLEERVQLLGGTMSAGQRDGDFVVDVWLPWHTDAATAPRPRSALPGGLT